MTSRGFVRGGWIVAALLAGCGDDGAGTPDGGGDDAGRVDGGPLAGEPDPPAPPVMACPTGWRTVMDPSETARCEPWPEGGMPACAAQDLAAFPGEAECVTIGTPCAPGEMWATDLPAAGVRFVLAGAPPDGDGTRAAPFGRIADALA